ncbi:tegument serine/threonine protein kinase [Pteropodid alphaherpesvirus 1]|uniref:Tegument serine/threonine protein kinase n=1 Tax=Pteropodid alphaherpesvirus 1 TaxID=1343901 RepID=A0A060Q1U1_9ALPH|nr:tegument serine/threonine protein kinase [Pteropodid alphaherpesvirus 1]BAP00692.1 tegument serine/threonine protein kinase [Pteropodid alphaherpesvirus 1]
MDESQRQRSPGHVAAELSPRGAPRRSLRSRIASYVRSLSRRSSGRTRTRSKSPRKDTSSQRHQRTSFRERLRAGFSRWRLSRSSHYTPNPNTPLSPRLTRSPIKRLSAVLTEPPLPPTQILTLTRIHKLCRPIFNVNPALQYTALEISGARSFGGSGGYGEVEIISEHKLAIKTIRESDWYAIELIATLLVGDCAIRALQTHKIQGFIIPLGFSLQQRQILFPAYDMDFSRYIGQLSTLNTTNHFISLSLYSCFAEMARAVVFLNTMCGISHLDIKCANILVTLQSDSISLRRAVLADFSLLTLNSNSVISHGQFYIQEPHRPKPRLFNIPSALVTANFHTLVGHGYNQPSELLLKYLNNERAEFTNRPLRHECGLSVDLYALGQALLELVVSAYVTPSLGVPVTRFPGYQYFNNQLCPDFAIAVLAYRCVLTPALFISSPETTTYGIPHDTSATISRRLRNPKLRRMFDDQCIHYQRTHKALLADVSLPLELKPLLVLITHLCHSNPSARHAPF